VRRSRSKRGATGSDGVDRQHAERVDLLGDHHGAELGGVVGADAAVDHQRGQQRGDLAQGAEARAPAEQPVGAVALHDGRAAWITMIAPVKSAVTITMGIEEAITPIGQSLTSEGVAPASRASGRALVEHRDPVGDREDAHEVVAHHDARHAERVGQLADQLVDARALTGSSEVVGSSKST
jgi:hypothetical protein